MVLISPTQATPAWLTNVLTRSGALTAGSVTAVKPTDGRGNWSQNARLTVTYSADARGDQPQHLFLKLVNTDLGDGDYFLPMEVDYYAKHYTGLPEAPLVRCYDAAYDPAAHRYHLLLDDLSATHEAAYGLTPTLGHGEALAEALAILHAQWWGPERLAQIDAPRHDAEHLRRFVAICRPGLPHVLSTFGDQLKHHWPDLLEKIFAKLPDALIRRTNNPTHFTLIHGDTNQGNLLVPKNGDRPLYLIDQQPFDSSLTTWLGPYDLAYTMGMYWPMELRRELERPVMQHYHQVLQKKGVHQYSWQQLWDDYRLCLATMAAYAVEYMSDGEDPDWNEFRFGLVERTLTAFEDLDCEALLDK